MAGKNIVEKLEVKIEQRVTDRKKKKCDDLKAAVGNI